MKIATDVLAVLSTMTVDGLVARLPEEQLERKLYERTNAVLVELGGKWTRAKRGHVFESDPAERIDAAIITGEVATARESGFFPTPIALAKRLVELADVRPGHHVLEPSAGTGRIVSAILRASPASVTCVEFDAGRSESLKSLVPVDRIFVADFLRLQKREAGGPFDRVIANPPFSRQQDIDHVLHMFSFLKPGGRLVSVMSASVTFRRDRKTLAFLELLAANDGRIDQLPDDSFAESGTSVRTVVVTIDKKITAANVIASA